LEGRAKNLKKTKKKETDVTGRFLKTLETVKEKGGGRFAQKRVKGRAGSEKNLSHSSGKKNNSAIPAPRRKRVRTQLFKNGGGILTLMQMKRCRHLDINPPYPSPKKRRIVTALLRSSTLRIRG